MSFRVCKLDEAGREVLYYDGELVARGDHYVCVRARFNFDRVEVGPLVFERGDVFTEWHYSDRWYNVFRVASYTGEHLKGWYCNITRPAEIDANSVCAEDLALDVVIEPDGTLHLLDEDEFEALNLSPAERQAGAEAVQMLRDLVAVRAAPFDEITPG